LTDLPGKDELHILYINRLLIGGFNYTDFYWSSTRLDVLHSWLEGFNGGTADFGYYNNSSLRFVRAIRAF
jgi:hypothetical protein